MIGISIGIPDGNGPAGAGRSCTTLSKKEILPTDLYPEGMCFWEFPGEPGAEAIFAANRYGYRISGTHTFGDRGFMMILDAYNANPSSMSVMLHSFAKQKCQNRLCILGDMLELGKDAKKEHQAIINLAEALKLECIFIGKEFAQVHKQAYASTDEFAKVLKSNSIKNKTILLKGSRGIALEKLVDLL